MVSLILQDRVVNVWLVDDVTAAGFRGPFSLFFVFAIFDSQGMSH